MFVGECAKTGPTGEYTITGLGEAEYVVTFSGVSCTPAACSSLNYVRQYYDGAYASSKDTKVLLKAHETKSLITAEMAGGGEIKGVVKDVSSKELLAKVQVCAGATITVGAETEFFNDCATTGPTGEYTLAGLPAGNYPVHFYTYAADYLEYVTPTQEHVTVGGVTKVDAELQPGGQITGRVTDAATHAAIAGVAVCSHGPSSACTTTGAGGEYMLSRLRTGTYEVSYVVEENEKLNYLPQSRSGVAVKQGETAAGINAELSPGGQITGRVIDAATHAGVTQVSVCAEEIGGGKAFQCGTSVGGGGSASASSNALAIPSGNFTQTKNPVFDAKKGLLDFFFNFPTAGKLSWSLFFKNADVGFADSLGLSLGAGEGTVAEAARKSSKKKSKKCKAGFTKHRGKCVHVLVPFGSGSKSVPAGTVEIKVHASSKAIKALKAGHTLHVSGQFTFQSALGGPAVTHTESAVVRLPKKHAKKHGKGKGH
jgi:Carboxypeptidase regulatory-like domain